MKYDVFISCNSDDYGIAEKVYDFLKQNDINPFLASKELRKIGDSEYRVAIENALEVASHIIVVASKKENLDSKWVRYEYGLFIDDKISDFRDGNIVTVLKDMPVRALPIALRKYESFIFDNFREGILSYVQTPESIARGEERKKRIEDEKQAELRKAQQLKRKKELETELKNLAEDYNRKLAALNAVKIPEITSKMKELGVTDRECPVCGVRQSVDVMICNECGWQFAPYHGLGVLKYLLVNDEKRIIKHKEIMAGGSALKDLEKERTELKNKIVSLESDVSRLNRSYNTSESKRKDLEKERNELKNKMVSLESDVSRLNRSYNTSESKRKDLEKTAKDYEAKVKALGRANDDLVKVNSGLVRSNSDLTKENKELDKANKELDKKNKDLESKLVYLEKSKTAGSKESDSINISQTKSAHKSGSTIPSYGSSNTYDVFMRKAGTSLLFISDLSRALSIELWEAQELIKKAPCCIKSGVSKSEADRLKRILSTDASIDVMHHDNSLFNITLTYAPKTLTFISVLSNSLGISLKAARMYAERVPYMVRSQTDRQEMARVKKAIEDAGGCVRVEEC